MFDQNRRVAKYPPAACRRNDDFIVLRCDLKIRTSAELVFKEVGGNNQTTGHEELRIVKIVPGARSMKKETNDGVEIARQQHSVPDRVQFDKLTGEIFS